MTLISGRQPARRFIGNTSTFAVKSRESREFLRRSLKVLK
jgi:hypothetical protein